MTRFLTRLLRASPVAALALAACGPDLPPPKPLPPAPARSEVEQAAAAVDDSQAVLYVYSPVGKRDPFRDLMATGTRTAVVDPRITAGRKLTQLQKFEIDQLKLQFTVTGTSSPMAMVMDPVARGHAVRIGDFIGKNWGKVSHIGREEITVTETIADQQTGRVYPVYIPMRMPKNEEDKKLDDVLDQNETKGL